MGPETPIAENPNPPKPPSACCSDSATAAPSPSPPGGSETTSHPTPSSSASTPTPTDISKSGPLHSNQTTDDYARIPIHTIDLDDDSNGRATVDQANVDAIAASVARNGQLNPITVRRAADRYSLIAGRHRIAAARSLGWYDIPAKIVVATDRRAAIMRLAENATRSNLTPVEEARQLAALLNDTPGGVDELATQTGHGVNWILDRLDICDWPEPLMIAVHNKQISMAAAKFLARIPDPELRDVRINDAARAGINARTASLWLQHAIGDQQTEIEMPESSSILTNTTYHTETAIDCVCCRRRIPLDHTRIIRCCTDCLAEMETAHATQSAQQDKPIGP